MKQPIDQAKRFLRLADADNAAFNALKNHAGVTLVITCFQANKLLKNILKQY